jgi:hypothetical protein
MTSNTNFIRKTLARFSLAAIALAGLVASHALLEPREAGQQHLARRSGALAEPPPPRGPELDPLGAVNVPATNGAVAPALPPARLATPPLVGDDARRAILGDLEASLRAHVTARWDGRRELCPRSLRIRGAAARSGTPLAVARALVREVEEALGDRSVATADVAPASGRALVAASPIETAETILVSFAAYVDSLPIEDGTIKVELRRVALGLVPVSVVGRFHPDAVLAGAVSPSVEVALETRYPAVQGSGFRAEVTTKLVAEEVGPGAYRRAFEVTAPVRSGETRREVVDAETGAVLVSYGLTCGGEAKVLTWEGDPGEGPRTLRALADLTVSKGAKHAESDAKGAFSLTGAVTLDQGFSGPLVRVMPDGQDAFAYQGSANMKLLEGPDDEASIHQDEASAFVYATTYNAHMRKTFKAIKDAASVPFPILVGSDMENAFFAPGAIQTDDGESFTGYVDLGIIGGNSCARDGSVVKHEYTHALLAGCAYLYGSNEAVGVNEALADYFPCSAAETPLVGAWTRPPYVRALDNEPKKLVWPADAESEQMEVHRIGNILNQALWQARVAAEADASGSRLDFDQAVFGGVLRMPSSPSLADACEAIVAAAEAQGGGAHVARLEAAFADHGLGALPDGGGADDGGASDGGAASSDDIRFSSPRKKSYVVHVDDTLEVPLEAVSASGEKLTLAASELEHAKLEKHGATAKLVYAPTDDDRGRHTVTVTATGASGAASVTLTIVVRRLATSR